MEWCFDARYEYPKGSKKLAVDPIKIGQPDEEALLVRPRRGLVELP